MSMKMYIFAYSVYHFLNKGVNIRLFSVHKLSKKTLSSILEYSFFD